MHEEMNVVLQVAMAIVTATAFAFLAKGLRQPLILGYIAAGILVGPTQGLGLITTEAIEPISELGLLLLLFMIGLEIDLKSLRASGKPVLLVGFTQFPLCVGLGLLLLPALGLTGDGAHDRLYLAVAAALSSTMIVVKLLYDKQELETLPGRITLGTLVFQDIWAILFLALQPNLNDPKPLVLVLSLIKGLGLIAATLALSRYVLPVLFRSIAKLPELMLIAALGWCFLVAMVASELDLSLEMGALIAGVAISAFPYNLDVVAKIVSLRDFFITLFFVSLGTRIPRPTAEVLLGALALSAFLIASRFITVPPVLLALRQGNRASLVPAINLSQISEFSLVIGSLGLTYGHIGEGPLSLVVITLVITSVLSTYGILYNHEVFTRLNPHLARLGLRDLDVETGEHRAAIPPRPIVLVGFWRQASSLLHELLSRDAAAAGRVGVVDFNPEVKAQLDRRGIANLYGDVSHMDTLHHASLEHADVLVCTLPDSVLKGTTNGRLLRQLKSLAPKARVIVTADVLDEARRLYAEGAAYVYVPRLMSARELAAVVEAAAKGDVRAEREAALAALDGRREIVP